MIDSAATAAVSVRRTRGPSDTAANPATEAVFVLCVAEAALRAD